MSKLDLTPGRNAGNRHHLIDTDHPAPARRSHAVGAKIPVQSQRIVLPHYPFQPLPTPNAPAPYRYDLNRLLSDTALKQITDSGKLVFHTVGDTGDARGRQMDFVAALLTQDHDNSPTGETPAFLYHLGDIVYFAGDVQDYAGSFYETYAEYPAPIVAIAGNHDCQPDDPQDGPIDENKKPLDGWIQNFMSKDPTQLGSRKTSASRTQLDLPNVYWTFQTPFATLIGLFTNVSETEAEVHQDQLDWFQGELRAADPEKALIVAIHHPPFSGDTEHAGSSTAERILFDSFDTTGRYPHLILSGHVHNYQRFTAKERHNGQAIDVPTVVAGAGGYTRLGRLHKINGQYPDAPQQLNDTLKLEQYDQERFGFLRIEVNATTLTGTYYAAPYSDAATATKPEVIDQFEVNLNAHTVTTRSPAR